MMPMLNLKVVERRKCSCDTEHVSRRSMRALIWSLVQGWTCKVPSPLHLPHQERKRNSTSLLRTSTLGSNLNYVERSWGI